MRIASFTSLFVISFSTGAQDFSLSEEDFLAEDPVVINSATRISQDINDVPASVTVIDRQMIEASSAINLIELLRMVPGFQVGSIDGTESTATYHGLSSQHNTRLQILINGRSVYQSTFGGALWYSLPVSIDEIERIEVIRGPNAASYGANAFSAVVNITTFASDHEPGLKISHLNGDRDIERTSFSYAKAFENSSFRLTAEHESNTGYQLTYEDPTVYGTAFPLYDDHIHQQMNLRFDHGSNTGALHTLEVGFKNLKFGGGYFDTVDDGTFDEVNPYDKHVTSHYLNYIWQKKEGLLLNNQLQISHNYVDMNERIFGSASVDLDGNGPLDPVSLFKVFTIDQDFRDQRFDIEFQQNRIHSPNLQTVWGVGARYDVSDSIGWLATDEHSRYSLRTFGHIEYKQNNWMTWNAGGFLENHENIGTYFSPRLAVNLKPSSKHTFRVNASRAYRMPQLFAEYADQTIFIANDDDPIVGMLGYSTGDPFDLQFEGNSRLDPERMVSFELGYRGLYFDEKLDIDIRIARENIKDIINSPKTRTGKNNPLITQFRWLNYGKAELDSVEFQVKFMPTPKSLLLLHASHTNVDGYRASRATDSTGDPAICPTGAPVTPDVCFPLPLDNSVPLLTTGALFSHEFNNGFSIGTQYTYHDAYRTGGDGDALRTPLESVDIKISKKWLLNNNEIKASVIVKNIADEIYEDFNNDNLVDREAYFQLEVGLH